MPEFLLSESTAARRRVFFTAVKTDDVNDRLTAAEMSTFTLKLSKNGGTPATPSGTTVTEVDSATQPGVWYVALNAADLDTLGDSVLVITNAGGSKAMRPREVRLRVRAQDPYVTNLPVDTVKWNGTAVATPTTAGVPRVDVKAMEASVLTATAIASDAITAAKIAPGAIDLATFAADALLSAFGIADSGTARAGGTSTTLKLALTASASDDRYLNGVVLITGGTGAGQINQVDDYTGATQTAAMKLTWATTPDATSTYVIYAGGAAGTAPAAATVATAVWAAISENATGYGDQFRGMFSVLAGLVNGFATGTLNYKSMDGSKTRLIAVDDEDLGRISIAYVDLTP